MASESFYLPMSAFGNRLPTVVTGFGEEAGPDTGKKLRLGRWLQPTRGGLTDSAASFMPIGERPRARFIEKNNFAEKFPEI